MWSRDLPQLESTGRKLGAAAAWDCSIAMPWAYLEQAASTALPRPAAHSSPCFPALPGSNTEGGGKQITCC